MFGSIKTIEDYDFIKGPLDYRYYNLDGETLFEKEGITDKLKERLEIK